jgi:hypothetical protein
MKRRFGYVSNSSSSSFVLIGKEVGNLWYDEIQFDKNKMYFMFGVYLCDGCDLIHLDAELAKWFKKHHEKNDRELIDQIDGTVIECAWYGGESEGETLPAIEAGNKIWAEQIDDHSTYDMKTAEGNYCPKGDR